MFVSICVTCLAIAGSLSAVPPPIGYIGIFKDATHNIANPSVNTVCPATYGSFEAWIWCLPSENGLQAAEFAVSFPATTVILGSVQNPLITITIGSLPDGISIAFSEGMCQMDWVWTHQFTMMLLDRAAAKIEIIPHPGTSPSPAYRFASCEYGYPIELCIYLMPLSVCYPIGVEQANWGAIKSLF